MQSLLDTFPHDRFWNKVLKTDSPENPDGCWLWTGSKIGETGRAYGGFMHRRHRMGAHRWSWALHNGPIPEGMVICHRCDTPLCVRPDHLFLGTIADNVRDMWSKGRARIGARKRRRATVVTRFRMSDNHVAAIQKAITSSHVTDMELAEVFDVPPFVIWAIRRNQFWWRIT